MTRARKPVTRKLRWEATEGFWKGRLTLVVGKDTDQYLLREIGADFGRGFSLEHVALGTVYDVNVNNPVNYSTCDCPRPTSTTPSTTARRTAGTRPARWRSDSPSPSDASTGSRSSAWPTR
jgi:hypothetical protein